MKRIDKIIKDLIIYSSIGIGILCTIIIAFFFFGVYLMGW